MLFDSDLFSGMRRQSTFYLTSQSDCNQWLLQNPETQTLQKSSSWPLRPQARHPELCSLYCCPAMPRRYKRMLNICIVLFFTSQKLIGSSQETRRWCWCPACRSFPSAFPGLPQSPKLNVEQNGTSILLSQHTCWRHLETGFDSSTAGWVGNLLHN